MSVYLAAAASPQLRPGGEPEGSALSTRHTQPPAGNLRRVRHGQAKGAQELAEEA